MNVLKQWPEKQSKSKDSPLIKYMDGKIYKFSAKDVADLGYDSNWQLKNDLLSVARNEYGPWQARTSVDDDGLIFQFHGPKDCRASNCADKAVGGRRGYCETHAS